MSTRGRRDRSYQARQHRPLYPYAQPVDTYAQNNSWDTLPPISTTLGENDAYEPAKPNLTLPQEGQVKVYNFPAESEHDSWGLMTSTPTTSLLSPFGSDDGMLPSYNSANIDGSTVNNWKTRIPDDVGVAPGSIFPPQRADQLSPIKDDEDQMMLDSNSPPDYHHNGNKPRSAHRKAIEEKSSQKRKNAEQRLSTIITRRLGGTFVPGLANQLNHAADMLHKDERRIAMLEEENQRLRQQIGGDVKVRHLL